MPSILELPSSGAFSVSALIRSRHMRRHSRQLRTRLEEIVHIGIDKDEN